MVTLLVTVQIYVYYRKYSFLWSNISHALQVPFGHIITVPHTADIRYFHLYIWKYFFTSSIKTVVRSLKPVQKSSKTITCCMYFQKIQLFIVFPKNLFTVYNTYKIVQCMGEKFKNLQKILVSACIFSKVYIFYSLRFKLQNHCFQSLQYTI